MTTEAPKQTVEYFFKVWLKYDSALRLVRESGNRKIDGRAN
jgi:hypothetical protein